MGMPSHGPRFALALLSAAALSCGACGTPRPDSRAGDIRTASVVRTPLPVFEPGARDGDLASALAAWEPPHRFTSPGVSPEGWEWTGPDGGRVVAYLQGGRALHVQVSRTWGTGAPAVDGLALPRLPTGGPLVQLESAIGPGMLVSREWTLGETSGSGSILEAYRWAIHDRGVDTGLFLSALARDGVVIELDHRWSEK